MDLRGQDKVSFVFFYFYFIYSSLLPLCNRLGYERPTSNLFNRYQHPFGHTSGASEIILTNPIYRPVAGGETSTWTKPSCDISPSINLHLQRAFGNFESNFEGETQKGTRGMFVPLDFSVIYK
jgi:hypothetical protein